MLRIIRSVVIGLYIFCGGQFLFVFYLTSVYPELDRKTMLMLSAVIGIILSGVIRRSYQAYLLHESTKPLDEKTLREIDKKQ